MSYEYERDEWRRATYQMTELQRASACGHMNRRNGVCPDCGDDIRGEV